MHWPPPGWPRPRGGRTTRRVHGGQDTRSDERCSTMTRIHRGPMTGRTVLVTGGSRGIGKATAVGLSAMGAHVAITGRDRGRTEAAAREIRAVRGGPVDVFVADL